MFERDLFYTSCIFRTREVVNTICRALSAVFLHDGCVFINEKYSSIWKDLLNKEYILLHFLKF